MQFEWDEKKNNQNIIKHGISFETARRVFEDPHLITGIQRDSGDEERWVTIGIATGIVILYVVHSRTELGSDELIRMITARKATPRERRAYEEGIRYS
jgi:uncharacterized DUF497 family protein